MLVTQTLKTMLLSIHYYCKFLNLRLLSSANRERTPIVEKGLENGGKRTRKNEHKKRGRKGIP